MQNRLRVQIKKKWLFPKGPYKSQLLNNISKYELKWTGGEISVQLAKGVHGYKRTVYVTFTVYTNCTLSPAAPECVRGVKHFITTTTAAL